MPGGFWTLPRWHSRRYKYKILRSPKDEVVAAPSKAKRPGLLDQLIKRLMALSRPPTQRPTPEARGGSGDLPRNVPMDVEKPKGRLPAGLRNLGNTCFMNAVLQCLNSTDMLSDYLTFDRYRRELLNRSRRRRHRQTPDKDCALVDALVLLIKALWAPEDRNDDCEGALRLFRAAVARQAPQYEGSDQHDAQEFLFWLLDHLHQELQACQQRNNHKVASPQQKQQGVHGEFEQHQRWRSPVGWLFEGCLRLRLTCPRCGEQSDTFDPFLGLSLPLPSRVDCTKRRRTTISLRLTLRSTSPPQVRVNLEVEENARAADLLAQLSAVYKVPEGRLLLLEETPDGLGPVFEPESPVPDSEGLIALELPKDCPPPPHTLLLICRSRVGSTKEFFGWTCAAEVPRESSYGELLKKIVEALQGLPGVTEEELRNSFSLLLIVGEGLSPRPISTDVDHPLLVDAVELAMLYSRDCYPSAPPHVRLILEWESSARQRLLPGDWEEILEDSPQREVQDVEEESLTLDECLRLYFTAEKLEPDEAWLCPHCNSRQQGVAQLSLWSCPKVLVIHLKRFQQERGKLGTPVEIPLQCLDLSPYLCPGALSSEALYDLYALCNHHGSGMNGGHYTACCKHPADGRWYIYDDTRVRSVREEHVVTCDAYLLFFVQHNPTKVRQHWSPFVGKQTLTLHSSRSHDDLRSQKPRRRTSSLSRREDTTASNNHHSDEEASRPTCLTVTSV